MIAGGICWKTGLAEAVALSLMMGCASASAQVKAPPSVARWGVFELSVTMVNEPANPFLYEEKGGGWPAEATFTSPSGKKARADGFYDGGRTWRVRFCPGEAGEWRYGWRVGEERGEGQFACKAPPASHGHLRLDAASGDRRLRWEDGSPFHWMGGKWFHAAMTAPAGAVEALKDSSPDWAERSVYDGKPGWQGYRKPTVAYLDYLRSLGLNGILIKCSVYPVKDDLKSFDLEWLRNMEDLLRLAGERGIAAQINVFDTWGKRKADADHSRRTPHPGDLVLEPWNPDTYRDETEWYLRYVIARFAAFPNVMWELGNEVGHEGVDFTPAARAYSKIIRGHDPYGLPIGMSEHREALEAGPETLDIDLTHCCYKSDSPTWAADDLSRSPWTKATLFNELPYKDEDADNPRWAKWFRHLYWETFVLGGAGASELSWMDVDHGRNAVSEYHGRLAALLRELGDYGAVEPAEGLVSAAPRRQWAAKVGGVSFVVYLLGDEQGTVELKLPAGRWWAFWCDPKTGDRTQPVPVSGRAELAMPPIAEDVVLVVEARPAG